MIDYEKIISRWQNDVALYCMAHNIPCMELRNLRMGDVCDYDLYNKYKLAQSAVAAYRRTPASVMRANEMIDAIKRWYIASSNSQFQKISMRAMTRGVFAHYIGRQK